MENRDFVGSATSRRSSLIQMATTLRRRGEAHEVHAAVPGSIGRAPRRRESLVEEESTQRVVD